MITDKRIHVVPLLCWDIYSEMIAPLKKGKGINYSQSSLEQKAKTLKKNK